ENLSMDSADSRFIESVINDDLAGSQIVNIKVKDPKKIPGEANGVEDATLDNGKDKAIGPADAVFTTALFTGQAAEADPPGKPAVPSGLDLLTRVDLFNLLCVPGLTDAGNLGKLTTFARDHRAFLIADSEEVATYASLQNGPKAELTGDDAVNA